MLLVLCCGKKETTLPLFTNANGECVSPQNIPKTPSMTMEFDAFGKRFKIWLRDSSHKVNGVVMKTNLCDFSVYVVNGTEAYGSISFCDSIHGSFVFSGSEYRICSFGPEEIEVEESRDEAMNTPTSIVLHRREASKKFIKVLLVNDFERVQETGPNVNFDTIEIFNNAKMIFENNNWSKYDIELVLSGVFNVVDRPLMYEPFDEFRRLNRLRSGEAGSQDMEHVESIERLRTFSEMFASIEKNSGAGELLAKANMTFLLQASDTTNKVNGLTFVGGAGSSARAFGIIKISDADSYFYKGKILAHELSHALGARHDLGTRHLMRKSEDPVDREEDASLSQKSITDIEDFISQNHLDFGDINTCGNGIMDKTKECDSGLPFGSSCCTRECKLRPQAQCDDRNGRCCKGCKLLPRNTSCRIKSSNVDKMDCEENSYCDGVSAECKVRYAEDGTRPSSGGVCRKGVSQTEHLMCRRLGRYFDHRCMSRDGRLWCIDEYGVCMPVLADFRTRIDIPRDIVGAGIVPTALGSSDKTNTSVRLLLVMLVACVTVLFLLIPQHRMSIC